MQDPPPHPRAARWILNPAAGNTETARRLADSLGCPPAIARLLVSRGQAEQEATNRFLNPTLAGLLDPSLMLGMAAAVQRIEQAVRRGEKILIYGDYDVDGTLAIVLLKSAIERIAPPGQPAQVAFHVPHRLREGYGMQNAILAQAAESGVRLVISVDTGMRAFSEAIQAKALGLDLIVTDHHLPDHASGLPEALAVLNPAQPGCSYPNKNLCGAGVAFKLAHALLRSAAEASPDPAVKLDRLHRILLPSFLKLLAIATVADSVSLTGENRAIVSLGLRELRNPVQPGLRALMEVAQLPLDRSPTAAEVGFRLAPRINAAGRMDVATDVIELFLTRDPARAAQLARKLDELNQARRASEASALEAIEPQLLTLRNASGDYPARCIVLGHPEWHRGVLGILASRVVDRTRRPVLIFTEEDGDAHGSGRSIPGFHLLDALTAVHRDDLFHRFGGHAHAVGFSLASVRLELLRERMNAHSTGLLTADMLLPEIACDVELDASEITPGLFPWLERCAPFGLGNPEPVFLCRGLTVAAPVRIIKDRHVSIALRASSGQGFLSGNALGWSRASSPDQAWPARCAALSLQPGSVIDAVFRLRQNLHPQFGGVELELADIASHSPPEDPSPSLCRQEKAASF